MTSDSNHPESNRRKHERHAIWFPVRLEASGNPELTAVAYDASQGGLRISSAMKLEVGTEVTLTFRVPPDSSDERRAIGKILRVEPNKDDPDGFWKHRLAIEFTEPLPELEKLLVETKKLTL